MTAADDYRDPLRRAQAHALEWLSSVDTRHVGPTASIDELMASFSMPLPTGPTDPGEVVDELARLAEPGLMAMPSGRFFGWVIGGTLPAALGADWLVSAWDQNAAMRLATPATAAAEEVAGRWLLELLRLPATSAVGFATGGTTANFVGLAAGRQFVLQQAGWDLDAHGLSGAPRITVLVGEERHTSVDLALRYLGLGRGQNVAADEQGRIVPSALAEALAGIDGPVIVALQAGNLHSGAFDPMRECIELAHASGAWVHVDGAFGLWAAVSESWDELLDGLGEADSWATDAHKTLNVPYDCGVAIVSRPQLLQETFGARPAYLIQEDAAPSDPFERVPEFSRRARGVPVWAAVRQLGRSGVIALVEGLAANARALAGGISRLPGAEILNEVVFTQVSVSFGSDERTRAVTAQLMADGAVWMSGSRWRERDILRISVSNWSTDATHVANAVTAVADALAAVDAAGG
ncbi:pyridoxal phosphate-dependent decarboxylase family protein [Lysinimonas soli]|uniref:Pyridoxal phosphate-dependent decarboxylase family protein n=1 Tax=Lysinimonas soli TaxID=1074233 RepID=A0ABW0NSF7_9MICO